MRKSRVMGGIKIGILGLGKVGGLMGFGVCGMGYVEQMPHTPHLSLTAKTQRRKAALRPHTPTPTPHTMNIPIPTPPTVKIP